MKLEEIKDNVVCVYHFDTTNVGDLSCCPASYFDFISNAKRVDKTKVIKGDVERKIVVVGGGGMVTNTIAKLEYYNTKRLIAWGVGTNNDNKFIFGYSIISDYDLVGCRDWGSPFEWVPCVSCMSPLFEKCVEVKPEHRVVVYKHHEFSLTLDAVPTMVNNLSSLESTLRFIASGETVITNSYHGVYWATLLGRKVVICDSQLSNKMFFFKHRHVMVKEKDCLDAVKDAVRYNGVLEECRAANMAFAAKVRNLIERS